MMKKLGLTFLLALAMVPAAAYAQVVIRIGPPPPVVERRPPPPERGYVWIAGYHRWEGDHYGVDAGPLGSSAARGTTLGGASVGSQGRPLGTAGRALAVVGWM